MVVEYAVLRFTKGRLRLREGSRDAFLGPLGESRRFFFGGPGEQFVAGFALKKLFRAAEG